MKKKLFISIIIFLEFSLQIFPTFATNLDSVPVWSDTSSLVVETSSEPTFDIASQAGILIELSTRKSFV